MIAAILQIAQFPLLLSFSASLFFSIITSLVTSYDFTGTLAQNLQCGLYLRFFGNFNFSSNTKNNL